jgi:hypothetical protein
VKLKLSNIGLPEMKLKSEILKTQLFPCAREKGKFILTYISIFNNNLHKIFKKYFMRAYYVTDFELVTDTTKVKMM